MLKLQNRFGLLVVVIGVLLSVGAVFAEQKRTVLKVCSDPNNMPFSAESLAGFENKIADVIAADLGLPIAYTWFPQSMGFIRNTLRKRSETELGYLCDLVIAVPTEYELAITTDSYFTSTYSLVINQAGKLKDIQNINQIPKLPPTILATVKIGLTERSPGAIWMAKNNLFQQIAPYISQVGDPSLFSGQEIFEDLSAGKTDAAIVWGPVAGYFTKLDDNLRLVAMASLPGMRLDYSISAGVRFRENQWRDQVNQALSNNKDKIIAILQEFNVPLLSN